MSMNYRMEVVEDKEKLSLKYIMATKKMVRTTVKDNGFEGILFAGNGTTDKVVIVMSGSNGGMKLTKQEAEFYHNNGVAASMFPDISCVVVRVPSYFVSEGLSGKKKTPSGTSCWSCKGMGLAYAPYKTRQFDILKIFVSKKEMHIITYNRDKDIVPDSIIPIEKMKAPILMLSSRNDSVWPSYESGSYMEHRLSEAGFPYEYKHIAYEYMSHALLTKLPIMYKLAFKTERTHAKACAADRENMKKELLFWIHNVWQ